MTRKQELWDLIKELEIQLEPLKEELRNINIEEEKACKLRVEKANTEGGDFKLDELTFAASSRCECGLGFAYPKNIGGFGSWVCSGILMNTADRTVKHSNNLPFAFYNVKSEDQPSANGATTRPK